MVILVTQHHQQQDQEEFPTSEVVTMADASFCCKNEDLRASASANDEDRCLISDRSRLHENNGYDGLLTAQVTVQQGPEKLQTLEGSSDKPHASNLA